MTDTYNQSAPLLAEAEYESEAFTANIIKVGLMHDGTSVLQAFNSKHERTALSYVSIRGVAHA